MTAQPVRLHPAALEEVGVAIDWYAERSRRAAREFMIEVSQAMERISDQPLQFPEFKFGTRRALLHKFPYAVVFRVTGSGIEIIAIAHGRRRPGYWHKRVPVVTR